LELADHRGGELNNLFTGGKPKPPGRLCEERGQAMYGSPEVGAEPSKKIDRARRKERGKSYHLTRWESDVRWLRGQAEKSINE